PQTQDVCLQDLDSGEDPSGSTEPNQSARSRSDANLVRNTGWNISGFVGFKPYVVHLGAGSFIQRSPPEQFTDGWKTAVVWASCFVAALAGWYVISTRRKPVGRGSPSDGSGDTPVGAA